MTWPPPADDLEAARALLDALGVREAVGDYTLQLQARPGQHKTLVLAPKPLWPARSSGSGQTEPCGPWACSSCQ